MQRLLSLGGSFAMGAERGMCRSAQFAEAYGTNEAARVA